LGIIRVGFDVTDLILKRSFAHTGQKKRGHKERVHELFIDFKKACDSVRRQVLYSILIELGYSRN
jgi:hypothetical protein